MSRCIKALLLLLCLTLPTMGENTHNDRAVGLGQDVKAIGTIHNQVAQPIWQRLAEMDSDIRRNSLIDIDISGDANQNSKLIAAEIQSMWNSGRYDEALGLFYNLQAAVDSDNIAIGISWKTPVKNYTDNQALLWERDISISIQDSVYAATLNVHQPTGNLFSVLLVQEGPFQLYSVNFSTDQGLTWAETYYFISSGLMPSVGSAVMGNRCYVAYPFFNSLRLKCFDVTNGRLLEFNDSTSTVRICNIGADDSLKEICLISNSNQYNNRLYCSAISTRGRLIFCWAGGDATIWNEILTGVGNADRGLDACFNEQFGDYYLYISYIDNFNRMNVFGRQNQTGPEQDEAGMLGR
jgi:hypothetical protein